MLSPKQVKGPREGALCFALITISSYLLHFFFLAGAFLASFFLPPFGPLPKPGAFGLLSPHPHSLHISLTSLPVLAGLLGNVLWLSNELFSLTIPLSLCLVCRGFFFGR